MLHTKNTVSKVIDMVFTAIVFMMIAAIALVAAILIFIITNMAGLGFITALLVVGFEFLIIKSIINSKTDRRT